MFVYDPSIPLGLEYVSSERRGHAIVQRVTYRSYINANPISAFIVKPDVEGTYPGILYIHWYEPHAYNSDATEFLDEAVMMSQTYGVESLLVETMWTDINWYMTGRTLATDYDDAVEQVINLRRALDLLSAQPTVDTTRIAVVGHDFGAMYGSLLAGIDRRAVAYDLIAGASDFNQWMLFGVADNQLGLDEYKAKMAPLAPMRYVATAAPAVLLFQFGMQDFYTPEEDYHAFFDAASEPKSINIYETAHAMATDDVRRDRVAFLVAQLGLTAR